MSDELREICLEDLYWPDETDITPDQIRNMALSILVHSQIEPIIVNVRDEKGYRGVIGRLRYEGMKERWKAEPEGKTISARIRKFESEIEIKMWQLAENLHRRELPPMEKARKYGELYDLLGEKTTIETLATAIEDATGNKESVKTVQHYLSLTKLEPKTQAILTGEKMPLRYGLELLRIKNPKKQEDAAKFISEHSKEGSDQFYRMKTVEDVKYHVDSVTEDERRDKQDEKLKKKAERLRAEGKTVYVVDELSYDQRTKKIRSFQYTLTPMPEDCKGCAKLGIELQRNFHQEPICTDPKCYEKKYEEKTRREKRELEESQRDWKQEQAKVYEMDPDVRHWRLAAYALIEGWGQKIKEESWKKIQTLDDQECKKLIIRHAVEKILTGPERWREDEPVKIWAIKDFGLKRELFLGVEAQK